MIIKELIEELQKLDPNMLVLTNDMEGGYSEPSIQEKKYSFSTHYWNNEMRFVRIPENTEFIEL